MESTSNERIKLALKVLSARYDRTVTVTKSEIEALKSYFQGVVTEISTEDLAGEVIQQELKEKKIPREKAKGETA
jgi:hypothetical protein